MRPPTVLMFASVFLLVSCGPPEVRTEATDAELRSLTITQGVAGRIGTAGGCNSRGLFTPSCDYPSSFSSVDVRVVAVSGSVPAPEPGTESDSCEVVPFVRGEVVAIKPDAETRPRADDLYELALPSGTWTILWMNENGCASCRWSAHEVASCETVEVRAGELTVLNLVPYLF